MGRFDTRLQALRRSEQTFLTSEVASCAGVDWAVMVELVTNVGFQLPLGFIEVHKAITSMFALL